MIGLKLTMVDDSLDERLDQPVLLYGTEFKMFEQHKKRGDRERTVTIIQQTGTYSFTQVAEDLIDLQNMIQHPRAKERGE
tara:strand:- start:719 stop:958 length:240 start_codon:yes stop_codon:yes gene_type:complete